MLVNRLGVTMVHTADDEAPGKRSHFAPSAVVNHIEQSESGFVEIEGDEPTIVVFFPLRSVQWHYVAVVDREVYLQSADDQNRRG